MKKISIVCYNGPEDPEDNDEMTEDDYGADSGPDSPPITVGQDPE